jgi:predicted metal-dependent hydrolase
MAKKEIIIENEKISYILKKYRRQKRVSFIFRSENFVITAPFSLSQKKLEEIIKKNSKFIKKNLDEIRAIKKLPVLENPKKIKKMFEFAKLVAENKLTIFNTYYNFCYKKIAIRDQKKGGEVAVL